MNSNTSTNTMNEGGENMSEAKESNMSMGKVDLSPNKFYKKIWFWLIILGIIGFFAIVLIYLYTDLLSTTTAYIIGGLFFGIVVLGAIISLFSKKVFEPTLKTFSGVDTKITADQILNMNTGQLEETLATVSGLPLEAIQAVEAGKMSPNSVLQFMQNK